MAQVSTDKIDAKIVKLLNEAESYRVAANGPDIRSSAMDAHFKMSERSFAIHVLEDLLAEAE